MKFCMKNIDFKCEYWMLFREKLYGNMFGIKKLIFCDKGLLCNIDIL